MENRLKVIESEPIGEDVIAKLEEVLERARKGELSSVAVAVVYRDGCSGQSWSQCPSLPALIGSVAKLKHKLLDWSCDE